MNQQINNQQTFVEYDLATQREYAIGGQLSKELAEEIENDILVEQIEK